MVTQVIKCIFVSNLLGYNLATTSMLPFETCRFLSAKAVILWYLLQQFLILFVWCCFLNRIFCRFGLTSDKTFFLAKLLYPLSITKYTSVIWKEDCLVCDSSFFSRRAWCVDITCVTIFPLQNSWYVCEGFITPGVHSLWCELLLRDLRTYRIKFPIWLSPFLSQHYCIFCSFETCFW